MLARAPEEHCAPPPGAANKVSVGVVHRSHGRPKSTVRPSGGSEQSERGVVHLQTDSGWASLAFAVRTNSQIFSGETLTPPTPAR